MNILVDFKKMSGLDRIAGGFVKLIQSLDKDSLDVEQKARISFLEEMFEMLDDDVDQLSDMFSGFIKDDLIGLFEESRESVMDMMEAEATAQAYKDRCADLEQEVDELKSQLNVSKSAESGTSVSSSGSGRAPM